MCAEVLSWREENWWERKSIPIGSHSVSPRQILLSAIFGAMGDLLSQPLPNMIVGTLYFGKMLPILAMLAVGVVIGSHRIRMIPVEFQLFLRLTKNKNLRPKN